MPTNRPPEEPTGAEPDAGGALADHLAIGQVLATYAHMVDRRDFAAVAACFTDDASARYNGIELGPGVDSIVEYISAVADFPASQHIFAPPMVHLDGDRATASSHAVSYLVVPAQEGDRLLSRGLTYDDELVRTPEGWRISRREHRPHWSTDQPLDWQGALPPGTWTPSM